MMIKCNQSLAIVVFISALDIQSIYTQKTHDATVPTHGFNSFIPQYILTTDKNHIRIRMFNFIDGIPTKETVKLVFDNIDFVRGFLCLLKLLKQFGEKVLS